MGQVLRLDDMARERERLRDARQCVVLTNGCFDLLHVGHARYLAQARALGDVLVVAVNDDAGVTRLKGAGRPILPLAERAELLAALAAVDYVVPFYEPTAETVAATIRPDVYVKGGDYADRPLPEAHVVTAHGGEVRLIAFVPGRSTTALIHDIARRFGPAK